MTHKHLKHQPSSLCTIPHTKLCSIHKTESFVNCNCQRQKKSISKLLFFGEFVKSRMNRCSSNPNLQSIRPYKFFQKLWRTCFHERNSKEIVMYFVLVFQYILIGLAFFMANGVGANFVLLIGCDWPSNWI
jgi:hypothetical protein